MRKTALAFILGVALPAALLAWLGLQQRGELERRELDRLRGEARTALAEGSRRLSQELASRSKEADALRWSEKLLPAEAGPLFFVTRGGKIADRPVEVETPPARELRLFERSIRGGEEKEFVERDYEGAADAYTFFLSSLEDPSLRASVILKAARAYERLGDSRLAARLYEEVAQRYPGTEGPEGEPLDALALLGLRRLGRMDAAGVAARLWRLRHSIDLSWARALHRELGVLQPPGFSLPEGVRDDLARLGRVPAEFVWDAKLFRWKPIPGTEVLAGTWIDLESLADLRAPAEGGASGGEDLRVRFHPLRSERLVLAGERISPRGLGPDTVIAEPFCSEAGVPLGSVAVESPLLGAYEAEGRWRRLWFHGVIAVLLVATAAGGLFVLRALRAELRLVKLKSEFIANVSHEMKTPVSTVRIFAEMLAEDSLAVEKARQYARVLRGESERLSTIVENLLDFHRLERGELALPLEVLSLDGLLRELSAGFAARAEREGVRFRADLPPLGTLKTSGSAVARILQNLVDNAIKYRRKEDPELSLLTHLEGDRVRIEVRDNGIGIPRGDRERIFEKFYRVPPEPHGAAGTGMGLALARELARRLGGDIHVESEPGKGSAFALVLPREGEDPSEDPAKGAGGPGS